MRVKSLALGLAVVMAAPAAITAAQAEDGIYIPLMSYRTGPYSGAGAAIFNGISDYLHMLNERDGGVGGVRLLIEECETGYDTKKGVECYESTKSKDPIVSTPYSTGITLQLIPKAAVDKVPILSMAYGLSASADGTDFPWVFNPPATYWDGASAFIRHVADVEGGFGKLKGKTIGFVHLDAPYGKEPIPLLQALAKDYGFELKLYPVPPSQMQNQTSLWLDVRRDRPDWIYMQGWGAMNPTALKEAAKVNFPMDHFVGVWWAGGEDDVRPAGAAAKGYLALSISGVGQHYPAVQDILKYVVDKGRSQIPSKDKVGEALYNRGVMNAVIIVEGIRTAQKLAGKKQINGEDMRRGLEALNITDSRWKQIGLPDFAAPIHLSCADHNGHNGIYLTQWNGTTWVKASGWIEPIKDKVLPLIDSAANNYVAGNSGWPKRTEACGKSS